MGSLQQMIKVDFAYARVLETLFQFYCMKLLDNVLNHLMIKLLCDKQKDSKELMGIRGSLGQQG